MPGPPELLILLIVILVLFGGAKLPKLAKSLGEAQHEFKKATEHATTEVPSPTLRPDR
jgi:sec-independent protein translocase protein TatA